MIVDYDGRRQTPKEPAQEAIMSAVVTALYQLDYRTEMTDRERALVEAQVVKQKERIERLLGYEPGSWQFA